MTPPLRNALRLSPRVFRIAGLAVVLSVLGWLSWLAHSTWIRGRDAAAHSCVVSVQAGLLRQQLSTSREQSTWRYWTDQEVSQALAGLATDNDCAGIPMNPGAVGISSRASQGRVELRVWLRNRPWVASSDVQPSSGE